MTVRARIADSLRDSGDIEAEAAVLVADGVVRTSSPEDAFDQWLALTEWLGQHMQPSARWQAVLVGLRHAKVAVAADGRSRTAPIMDVSRVLEIAKRISPDLYAQLRAAMVDELMGRTK